MKRSATALWLCLGYALFVVYGSLVPLDFSPLPLAEAWARFRNVPFLQLGLDSRADWVANGVLYAPLGFFAARALFDRGLPQAAALPLAIVLCSALAVAVEFTQLFFPPRTVSQNDIVAECIGSVVGAVLLPLLTGWLQRLALAWRGGGARLFHHLLQAYAVGYVLFCFFPFDLLLSMDELRGKLASGNWGWFVARPDGFSWLRSGLHWGVELALTLPFGFLLARSPAPAATGRAGLLRAALIGALLGAGIELAQIMVETAISQGVSVASRAIGMPLGLLAARAWQQGGIEPWRRWLLRHLLPLGAVYGLLLTLANGWWSHPWHGLAGAAASWQELRLLPFYYQYYTSEAIALYSSGSVVVMYLPLAALGWALRMPPPRAAALAGAAAFVMEAGKLFLGGTHPDPTDVLLAAASCWLVLALLPWLDDRPQAAAAPVAQPPAGAAPRSAWRHALPLVALAALGLALAMPAWPLLTAAVVLATGVAAWCFAPLLLAIVPAALPVFDLAPWTGRFFVDEFDLLLAAGLAVGFYRTPPPLPNTTQRTPWQPWRLAFAVFGVSLGLSALRAFWPNEAVDLNSFSSFYSSFNGLRIAKGALWAWLFVRLYQRIVAGKPARAGWFAAGLQLGLAATVAVVLWERATFAGWLDFTSPFRVSGPFSAMLRGGAYVECFLAVGSAFAMTSALSARSRVGRAVAWLLLAGTAYALVVTYSRNGYAAFAVVVAIGAAASFMPSPGERAAAAPRTGAPLRLLLPLLLVGLAAAALVQGGSFARERLAQTRQDFATRAAHWADALTLGSASAVTQVFGVGVGRFPQAHFWRSREPVHAASFDLARDGDQPKPFLRLGSGALVYVEQIVTLDPGANYRISARLRSASAAPRLTVMLCRKWGLTSGQCETATLAGSANGGQWQAASTTLRAARLLPTPWYARAPMKLSLLTPNGGGAVVDVDALRLEPVGSEAIPDNALDDAIDGRRNALANGDFSAGLDRWFFSTDTDPPWHIHNLPLALLFDQGWLGLLSGTALVLVALGGGWRALRRGGPAAMAPLAAFSAFLVSGSLNTLVDAPRFLWLFLVLAWLCAWSGFGASGRRAVDEHAQLAGGERRP